MKSKKKSDRFWDWIAKRYDRQTRKDQGYTRAVERFTKFLKLDDTVLDYACGTGVITFKIAAKVKEVHAIDTSAGMIAVAQKRASKHKIENVHFAHKTIFDGELAGKPYDLILAFNILHLVEDARKVLQRAFELLKPGGLLVSSTPCVGEAGVVLRTLLPHISKVIGLSYLRALSIAEVKDLMHDEGFDILESEVRGGKIQLSFIVARKC